MLVVGLTGGISSGKSTVARMLEEAGARIIDLDLLSRIVVEPGKPAWREIVACFGEGVLRPDGALDREALGRIAFGDHSSRRALEAIIHPRVWQEQERMAEEFRAEDPHAIVVVDVPLLIEVGMQEKMDAVILVHVPRSMQRGRLMARDGLSPEEADARLGAQMDIDDKVPHAHFIVDNTGEVEATRDQVQGVMQRLREMETRQGRSKQWPRSARSSSPH